MTLILDAGAFLAVEKNHRALVALLKGELLARRVPVTHGGVVGQVWRDGGRQVRLARLLRGVVVPPRAADRGRRAGTLVGRAGKSDVIDASVVLLAEDGDSILTSDPRDLEKLAAAAGTHVDLVPV
jgi:hypothetical protein